MVLGALLLLAGIGLVLWGAERFTDGAIDTAERFGVSAFFVGLLASGFEPENLVTGAAATLSNLPQVALGTVIGATIFLLTGALGLALLLVPIEVRFPRRGVAAMTGSLMPFAISLWNDGIITRVEGALLLLITIGLMVWLYPPASTLEAHLRDEPVRPGSRWRAGGLLVGGILIMVVGAELVMSGVSALIRALSVSETFLGMVVVALGESVEETARMVVPAKRGHPELAWGNVVGTVVILVGFNLGAIALVRPLTADPLILRLHAPYLLGCTLLVASSLLLARKLGRGMGAVLVALYLLYFALNIPHIRG
jgi:cation:H+ antiporter